MSNDAEVPQETVLVSTRNGPVLGRKRLTSDQKEFVSFQGVPFAQPPVGELRFKAPVPVANWSAPLDATRPPPVAPAMNGAQYDQRSSEDCLYLNIYTSDIRPSQPRPVMLYIHGGGFMIGSTEEAMFRPDFLLRQPVVFVTIAYRLGALGFLSVADPEVGVPGNAGLKDQALAMRWVRDNIAAFGGDAGNITLFGGSAGAGSVHFHLLSEYSSGLFQRAILQSGSAFNVWAQQPARDLGAQLARKLGWSGEGGVDGMMQVLRAAEPRAIAEAQHMEDVVEKQKGHYFLFVPVVEPYGAGSAECFLPRAPEELAATAWGNSVPMLIGCNSEEAVFFYGMWTANPVNFEDSGNFVNLLPPNTDELSAVRRADLAQQLQTSYYGEAKPSAENMATFADLQSDKLFVHGMIKTIRSRLQAAGNSAPTYVFRFNYDSPRPQFAGWKQQACGRTVRGTIHGEELVYLFRLEVIDYEVPAGSDELRVIDEMVNIWTTFAATGNPNNVKLDVEWLPAVADASSGYRCLNIGDQLTFVELPETERLAIWDVLEQAV